MKMIVAVALVFANLAGLAHAAEKIDAAMIVGKWLLVKDEGGEIPANATVEFTKEGKLLFDAGELKFDGKYTLKDDKLSVTMKLGEMEKTDVSTIKELTATKLVIIDGESKKAAEFKKK